MRERTRVVTLESSFWKQASSLMLCIVGDQFDTARSNLTPPIKKQGMSGAQGYEVVS